MNPEGLNPDALQQMSEEIRKQNEDLKKTEEQTKAIAALPLDQLRSEIILEYADLDNNEQIPDSRFDHFTMGYARNLYNAKMNAQQAQQVQQQAPQQPAPQEVVQEAQQVIEQANNVIEEAPTVQNQGDANQAGTVVENAEQVAQQAQEVIQEAQQQMQANPGAEVNEEVIQAAEQAAEKAEEVINEAQTAQEVFEEAAREQQQEQQKNEEVQETVVEQSQDPLTTAYNKKEQAMRELLGAAEESSSYEIEQTQLRYDGALSEYEDVLNEYKTQLLDQMNNDFLPAYQKYQQAYNELVEAGKESSSYEIEQAQLNYDKALSEYEDASSRVAPMIQNEDMKAYFETILKDNNITLDQMPVAKANNQPAEQKPVEQTSEQPKPAEEQPAEQQQAEQTTEQQIAEQTAGKQKVQNVPGAEEALQNYRNSGYSQNTDGEYFNPYKDEYDPDYNPVNDPTFNTNMIANARQKIADIMNKEPYPGIEDEVEQYIYDNVRNQLEDWEIDQLRENKELLDKLKEQYPFMFESEKLLNNNQEQNEEPAPAEEEPAPAEEEPAPTEETTVRPAPAGPTPAGPTSTPKKKIDKARLIKNGLAFAGGIAVGAGLSCVPGVNGVMMVISTVKMATFGAKLLHNGIKTWTNKHPDGKVAGLVDKIYNSKIVQDVQNVTTAIGNTQIAQGIKKINAKLKSEPLRYFVNGVSCGYVAGNIFEMMTGNTIFESVVDKLNGQRLDASVVTNSAPATTQTMPDQAVNNMPQPNVDAAQNVAEQVTNTAASGNPIPDASVIEEAIKSGQTVDISSITHGGVSSVSQPIPLQTAAGQHVLFDQATFVNGQEMWHMAQADAMGNQIAGYAWFPKEEVIAAVQGMEQGMTR